MMTNVSRVSIRVTSGILTRSNEPPSQLRGLSSLCKNKYPKNTVSALAIRDFHSQIIISLIEGAFQVQ